MSQPATPVQRMHWASMREAGTLFGLRFLYFVHRVFGRWLVSFCLWPTVAYFVLFRPASRRSSQQFLRAHYACYPAFWSRPPSLWDTCKHLYVFAQTVVDKLLSWSVDIDADQFDIAHPERIDELMADSRGQLIIGSHMGNLEYCRGFMHRYRDKSINILVHDKHSENYNTVMQQLNPDSRLNIFQVEEFDIPTMLTIKKKIDDGEWVFIAGDRTPLTGQARTVEVTFFGRTAHFPIGPYMLAQGLGCPVKLMFSYCDYFAPGKPVFFEVETFTDRVILGRAERTAKLQAYAQQFATALEQQVAKAPFQWFNFYDFWAEPTKI